MKLSINQTGKFFYRKEFIKKLFRVIALVMPRFAAGEVSVALVDNNTIKNLNRRYRKKDVATDVLSFAEKKKIAKFKKGEYLGEIIIAYPYLKNQAAKYGHTISYELAVLLTHGWLHLVGYDHLNKKDEQKMKRAEQTIINKLGIKKN